MSGDAVGQVTFGPFRLFPARQLLLDGDTPVHLGSRACEILIALVERAGQLLSNQELMRRVWPNTFVEDGNLRVHVAALRRALRDGHAGNRYITNVPGRGYCFVAPVSVAEEPEEEIPVPGSSSGRSTCRFRWRTWSAAPMPSPRLPRS